VIKRDFDQGEPERTSVPQQISVLNFPGEKKRGTQLSFVPSDSWDKPGLRENKETP